ncbi:MAG: hypothetical protein IT377_31045 [Polyangiaceae bacterium]|nr:hypothetical protein [Polyangiaceae bacterium]
MVRAAFAFVSFVSFVGLLPFACGGESSTDDDTGGASGTGGATSGGTGGAGGTGGTTSGGTGGTGGTNDCGPPITGDCVVCGKFALKVCVDGKWTCPEEVNCPDAGCDSGKVQTVDGCLTCAEASTKLASGIEAARKANASCGTEADCVLTGASTACSGSCQVAVAKSGEAAFQAALSKLDTDYCKAFVPTCGYSSPKCAAPTLVCTLGLCELSFK